MIADDEIAAEEPRLKKERVNETRYARTFTCEEVHKLLTKAVLDEDYVSEWSGKRASATIVVLAPGIPETLTVKVTVPE